MISLLRRFLGILSLGRRAGFSSAHGWVRPGSTITDSVEFSLRLDPGLVLPGDLRLERLFTRESAPSAPAPSAAPAPALPAVEVATAATVAPSTGTVVEPAAGEREERKTTRAA